VGFYTHAAIFSPSVIFFRTDEGEWTEPMDVDVVTCAAVNAKVVRAGAQETESDVEDKIGLVMRERMARVLCLFFLKGVKNLVLGSFGTGAFGYVLLARLDIPRFTFLFIYGFFCSPYLLIR
jgi:uncharacterized protein (TIGR02452 family)